MSSEEDERVSGTAGSPGEPVSAGGPPSTGEERPGAERPTGIASLPSSGAGDHPAPCFLRIIPLAALGYAYIGGVLLVFSLLVCRIASFIVRSPDPPAFLVLSSPLLLGALVVLYGTARAAWVRSPAPEGFEVTPGDSPLLFETLGLIRMELGGPKIHTVVITGEFSACLVRVPRLGIFGWHRNCLLVGLPLLQALSTGQMLAVLAREYGLLPGRGRRLRAGVCQARAAWMQLHRELEGRRGFGNFLLARFTLWYAPYFQSVTAPLARAHEFEADACAAVAAGKPQVAAALVQAEVLERHLRQSFWPQVSALRDTLPEPVTGLYRLMEEKLAEGPDAEQAQAWLEESLWKEPGPEGTRPCLGERLRALAEPPLLPASPVRSAARDYFPDLDGLREALDAAWRAGADTAWRERHEHVGKAKARLAELAVKGQASPLGAGESLEIADLTESLSGPGEALILYQRLLESMPRFVPALWAVGRIRLAQGDESGADCIEKAIALEPGRTIQGLEALYRFHMGRGDLEKTGECYRRLSEQRESRQRSLGEEKRQRVPARYMVPRNRPPAGGTPPHGILLHVG